MYGNRNKGTHPFPLYGVRAHLQTGGAYLFIVGVLRRAFPDRSLIQTEVFPDGSPLADGIAFSNFL